MRWISSSLKRKLSLLVLLSIFVPLLVLGLFSYNMATMATEKRAKEAGMSILQQISANLEFIVRDIENMSLFLIGQKDIQQYLSGPGDNPLKQTQIIEFLSNFVYSKNYISDITIYPMNQTHPLANTTIFRSGLLEAAGKSEEEFQSKTKWWSTRYRSESAAGVKQVISLVQPLRSLNSFKQIGTVVVSLDEAAVSQLLQKAGIPSGGYVMLSNKEGIVLSGSKEDTREMTLSEKFPGVFFSGESGTLNYGEGEDRQTMVYNTVEGVGWQLTGIMPFSQYKSENSYVLQLMVVVIVLASIIVSGFVLYFVQKVTNPLLALTQFLKHSNPEEPMQTYPVETRDEVGQLVRSYNKLGERIGRLTEQVKEEEVFKKEADMQALQAQINPHFLYNTLSSIHWMALMNQDAKTADMVGSLSDFLRFSLNKGEDYCTVEQETAHAHHYANIQSIRFPNKFKLTLVVDPALNNRMMLKLLLQPLIENALIHGIQKQEGVGEIIVTVKLQQHVMQFVVEDDGVGMSAQKLAELERNLHAPENQLRENGRMERGSYGLWNVHKRLQLHYGAEAGLVITSTPSVGTKVTFAIPLSEEQEENTL